MPERIYHNNAQQCEKDIVEHTIRNLSPAAFHKPRWPVWGTRWSASIGWWPPCCAAPAKTMPWRQLHELVQAHPFAGCRIILIIIHERDPQPRHGHVLEDCEEQDSGDQQEVQPTVLYHIPPCGLAPGFEIRFFRAFVFCHFHTLLSHFCFWWTGI